MTKKDFKLIAEVVASIDDYGTRAAVADKFADKLATINPRFDRARFIAACSVSAD